MKVYGKNYRAIWIDSDTDSIKIINQLLLPYKFEIKTLSSTDDIYNAISSMEVRGAPVIGATAAFGVFLACKEAANYDNPRDYIENSIKKINSARPTAINLFHATKTIDDSITNYNDINKIISVARTLSIELAEKNVKDCYQIGLHGLKIIEDIARQKKDKTVNILTHCNAGWLACGDYGTATAPIYLAHDKGINIHVWVDETRPRNQGAKLTAWELGNHGVKHTIIADNTGGHLMQNNMVDMVIVGCDRMALNGDFANKIGTYLKALAAYDNNVPFYVALPTTSIDPSINNGIKDIPIEIRSENEIHFIEGIYNNNIISIRTTPENSPALNYGFDITPAKYVSGVITEKGIFSATKEDISMALD
ncbi:MAG: S-methyl-5-thioribose-1-phosphate isomerase [Marinilabiliales bacterium]